MGFLPPHRGNYPSGWWPTSPPNILVISFPYVMQSEKLTIQICYNQSQ